eukprot:SAG31_NODE_4523_length_3168_cov_1.746497_1_plen_150_part_10
MHVNCGIFYVLVCHHEFFSIFVLFQICAECHCWVHIQVTSRASKIRICTNQHVHFRNGTILCKLAGALAQTAFRWTFNRKTDKRDEVPHKASAATALRVPRGDTTTTQLCYQHSLRNLLVLYGTTRLGTLPFVREANAGLQQDNFQPVDD